MKTVPLYGRKAAGRVALVDDENYDLVMQYRWNVWELPPDPEKRPGRRTRGPYAVTLIWRDGRYVGIRMHCLIMGAKGIDHRDHNGLNNQKNNLRVASNAQNNHNARSVLESSSQYKGVSWHRQRRRWEVAISKDGHTRHLGGFTSEIEAAYAYDAAARDLFGEFACTNFADEPARAMRDQWAIEREAAAAERKTAGLRLRAASVSASWEDRPLVTHVCENCGATYYSKATVSRYCGSYCRGHADYLQRKDSRKKREQEGLLF